MAIPAAAWPVISAGVSGLFSLFSGKASNGASDRAASIQARSMAEALAFEREKYAEERRLAAEALAYSKYRDQVADFRADQARADRGAHRAAAQGAVTTLGALLTPGQRVNGATGMVSFAGGGGRSLGDILAERTAQPVAPVAPAATPAASPAAASVNPASDYGAHNDGYKPNTDAMDPGMTSPSAGQQSLFMRDPVTLMVREVPWQEVSQRRAAGWTPVQSGGR